MSWNFGLDFGSALGGFVGLLGANASSKNQYKYQSRLQEQAARLNYEYGLKSLENSPTAQRTGLESAGYNPMLAVQNSTSGANSGWTTAGQISAPDYSQVFSNALDMKRVQNETAQTDSIVKLQEAQGRNVIADSIGKEIHNQFLPERERKELGQIGAATEKLIRETSFMDQLAENMVALRRLQEMGIYYDYAGRVYSADKSFEGVVYNADTNKDIADNHAPSGRSGSFENYTRGISNVLNGVGSIIHGYNETNNYNGSNESETVYYDKNGNVRGSVSHRGSNKGSSKKSRRRR